MRRTKQTKITLYRSDVEAFENQARRGEIPARLAEPAAKVLSAMRELQIAAGGGHLSLDVIFEALPSGYQSNWLKTKRLMLAA